ncbi:MAG: glycogen synthase [Thermoplasmatota archaeon]
MKVTILSLEYPPNVYGGVGAHVAGMASALSRLVEVEVRTVWAPGARKAAGVRRYGRGVRRGRPGGRGAGSAGLAHQPALDALRLDLELLSDPMDCDVVHSHTWYMNLAGALAKKLYGCPAVATVHSLEPLRPWKAEQLGRGYELSKWMEEEGLRACDHVVAVSGAMRRDVLKCYGIPPSRVSVVHNGIDPRFFKPSPSERVLEKYGIRRPYVLFVGRLTRQKGVFDLLEASRRFPKEATTVLATGRPDEPGILSQLSSALKARERVLWINRSLGRRELVALYSSASVAVTPSVYEPFGIVVLEAMACGAAVVASRVGGIPEIVEHGRSGLLVPPGRPDELAEAVGRLLSDGALRERLVRRARERVEERFTWEAAARETLAIYRRVCGRS